VLRLGVQEEVPCSYHQIEGSVRGTGVGSGFFPILFGDLIECTHMLEPGDCGAILVDAENYALGLGIAGSAEVSLFIPIQKVLSELQMDLVTGGNWHPAKAKVKEASHKRRPAVKAAGKKAAGKKRR
jgi:hypothetical protein